MQEDEGELIEPECFYPIIPTVLINGSNGIAMGYSTFIPNHNPIDIVNWLKNKISGFELPELKPWYRGFSGSIEVIDRRTKQQKRKGRELARTDEHIINAESIIPDPDTPKVTEESSKSETSEDPDTSEESTDQPDFMKAILEFTEREFREAHGRPLYSLVTHGKFHTARNGKVNITELPIGRWTKPYHLWLENLRDEHKLLREVRNVSKSDVPGFELSGFQPVPSFKTLNLRSQIGMSNMVLLDTNNRPHRYDTAEAYLEVFYKNRLEKYGVRKEFILREWGKEMDDLQLKRRFIQTVVSGDLVVVSRPKNNIFEEMDGLELPHNLLSETSISKFTEDEIVILDNKIKDLEDNISKLEATTPEKLWLNELKEFEREYRKHYKLPSKGDKIQIKIKKK